MRTRARSPIGRAAAAVGLAVGLVLVAAPPVAADPAGPTDYNTVIVAVEPASPAFEVEMIGGDAFLQLEQIAPVEIVVLGYQAEPYLRFDADGIVYENRRSPSVWLNQDRYGTADQPAFANASAPPEWFEVATNGRYAWHDHRSHWMNPQRPPGAEPGDQVLEATVPVTVADEPVSIIVASFLLDSPSMLPPILGALAGVVVAAGLGRCGHGVLAVAAGAASITALGFGILAYASVPAETEPSQLLWLLPSLALVSSGVLLAVRNHTATTVYLDGLLLVAAVTVATWVFSRRAALVRALIPSDAPAALDRAAITFVAVVGLTVASRGTLGLVKPRRLIPATEQKP